VSEVTFTPEQERKHRAACARPELKFARANYCRLVARAWGVTYSPPGSAGYDRMVTEYRSAVARHDASAPLTDQGAADEAQQLAEWMSQFGWSEDIEWALLQEQHQELTETSK
jgi:hypothetical protein